MKENMWLGCATSRVLSCIYLQDMHLNFHLGVKGGDDRFPIADLPKGFSFDPQFWSLVHSNNLVPKLRGFGRSDN